LLKALKIPTFVGVFDFEEVPAKQYRCKGQVFKTL